MLFRQILEQHPSYARAFQELGHLYRDANMPAEALNSYATACHLNPGTQGELGRSKALDKTTAARAPVADQSTADWLETLPPNLAELGSIA